MKVDVEEISPCTKQLKIEIPQELYIKEEEKAYRELGKKVKIAGFRKGKIPKQYLQKLYHDRVKNDVLNKIIPESYYKAVEEKDLKPVGSPRLENITNEKDSPITFTATIDIIPPIEVKNYEGLEFTKKIVKITEKDIETELGFIKERYATYEEITGRSVKEGDLVITDFKGFINGSPLQGTEAKSYPLVIGSNNLVMDFEKGFIGMKKNEEKDIAVTYPAAYMNKELAGKNVLFKVKVNEIKIKKLPEITDQFVKNEMGKDKTVEGLKEEIRRHQEKREKLMADGILRAEVLKKIIELNPFEIPQVLVENQIDFMIEDIKQRMRLKGIKEDNTKIEREKFREDAIRIMKGELIQQKIAEMEKIEVNETEIEEELGKLAAERKINKEKLKISMQKDNSYNGFLDNLLRKKTIDTVLSKLKIKEVIIDRNELDAVSYNE